MQLPAPRACGLEELRVEPGVDQALDLAVTVRGSGADECRGALGVAASHGDGGKATEAFARDGSCNQLAADREFLSERVPGGVRVAGQ
jgi:hypothetical protein